jgi:hypothetical protein
MDNEKLFCFTCFKELDRLYNSNDVIDCGTSLNFVGNYGSIFDGFYGRIYICDSCIDSRIGTYFFAIEK